MKNDFIKKLKDSLIDRDFPKSEIKDILNDYEALFVEAMESGKTEQEAIEFLGQPRKIAKELTYEYHRKHKSKKSEKIIALSPFIAVIIFFILGMVFDTWHPTWLIFLIIPASAIIIETPGMSKWVALSPFLSVAIFMLLGTFYDLWVPGWLVFLLIPMLGVIKKSKMKETLITEASFLIAIAFYLYMGYALDLWTYGLLGFILPLIVGIIYQNFIVIHFDIETWSFKEVLMVTVVFLAGLLYVLSGFIFSAWGYMWQIFLFIPMAAIILFDRFRFVAISPFIAVILFFSLGFFLDLWHISWLAFFIIPMAGILEGAD